MLNLSLSIKYGKNKQTEISYTRILFQLKLKVGNKNEKRSGLLRTL